VSLLSSVVVVLLGWFLNCEVVCSRVWLLRVSVLVSMWFVVSLLMMVVVDELRFCLCGIVLWYSSFSLVGCGVLVRLNVWCMVWMMRCFLLVLFRLVVFLLWILMMMFGLL